MYPLVLSTVLGVLSVHSPVLGKPICWWFNRKTLREKELLALKRIYKREQSMINMANDFAKYSKLQRKINTIDEELIEINNKKRKTRFAVKFITSFGLRAVFTLILIVASLYYRKTPVIHLSSDVNLLPFTTMISYPNTANNSVSFHFWAMCCTAIAKLFN